jgi:hypothetical protein
MNPIAHHDLGQARHKELETEFEHYRDTRLNRPSLDTSKHSRVLWGIGSMIIGTVLIVQILVS